MSNLTIEAGKFYKTRGGYKAKVFEIFDEFALGYYISLCLAPNPFKWHITGISCPPVTSSDKYDLIAPWTDPPVVDWGRLPLHIVAVAKDGRGRKMGFTSFPEIHEGYRGWRYSSDAGYHQYIRLASDAFAFSGDWRDSLAVRPGWEGKENA